MELAMVLGHRPEQKVKLPPSLRGCNFVISKCFSDDCE